MHRTAGLPQTPEPVSTTCRDLVIQLRALLHDLLPQVACTRAQFCVFVLGHVDAFVYAFNQQRRNRETWVSLKTTCKDRIRFMTALPPAYAHANQTSCSGRGPSDVLVRIFRLLICRPFASPLTFSILNFRGRSIITDGRTRTLGADKTA